MFKVYDTSMFVANEQISVRRVSLQMDAEDAGPILNVIL